MRDEGVSVIVADQCGVFSRILTDFGPIHTVLDKDGEEVQSVMISAMKAREDGGTGILVELLTGATHNFEEGNMIVLTEVIGDVEDGSKPEINGQEFKVSHVVNRHSFVIAADCASFQPYNRNGVAKLVKTAQQVEFTSLDKVLGCLDDTYLDKDLQMLDFCKMENFLWAS